MSAARDPSIVAADPTRSAWVAANAGSGKTYTLANRVTRLLLDGAKPERILCLTYTKAAAAEMQGRLFAQLGELSMLPDDKLRAKIAAIGGSTKGDLGVARRLFAEALETPGGLKIQTIHSFCQTVLARFPLEARVPPGFRVLDEQTANELMTEARKRVLERTAVDVHLNASLSRLVTQVSEKRLNDFLQIALSTDRRKLEAFFASLKSGHDALALAMRASHGVGVEESEESIANAFCDVVRAEADKLEKIVRWLETGLKSDRDRARRLAEALAQEAPIRMFPPLHAAFLKVDGDRHSSVASKGLAARSADALGYLERFVDRFWEAELRRRAAYAAEMGEAMLTVADAVRREYASAKRARGMLDYDDLIARTRQLLYDRNIAQWVLFKLDNGLDHVLVDEAQDTSPEQWAIVTRLTEEFFAGAGARDSVVRTIFAVGDEKQSIFSFQGAAPEQFEQYRLHFEKRATEAALDFADVPLTVSRRSAPEILKFVDQVFRDPAARDGLTTSTDIAIEHQAHRSSAKGRVEFWPAVRPAEEPEPDPLREVDVPSEASPESRLAERIADRIAEWIDKRVRLPERERPIRPGDIMILLPRREPFGSQIIRKLKDRNIPVAGADRMRLIDQLVVKDLVALGRFALMPDDELTLAALLRSPFCNVSEEGLFALCHERQDKLWAELTRRRDEDAAYFEAWTFLSDMLRRADFMPPFEFYSHALTAKDKRQNILTRLGAEARDAIDEFVSLAFAYEAANTPSLEGFLHWIEQGGAEVKRDMERGRDEVRVMTVHAAKGLEADIVFLPDTTTVPQTPAQKAHLLYDGKQLLFPVSGALEPECVTAAKARAYADVMREHRRLLYVALTRAKDRLYICGFENKQGIKPESWYRLTEKAAKALGTPVERDGETILVIGELGDQFGMFVEPGASVAAAPDWALQAPAPEPPLPRLIRPSDATGSEDEPHPTTLAKQAQRFRRGVLVHAMLAQLPEIDPSRRADTARRYLTVRARPEDDVDALIRETLAVLDDPLFSPAFGPSSRAEVAFVAELPEIGPGARVNGRVDRLSVGDSDVLIVDFKTNRPPPKNEGSVAPVYMAQMALYRAAAAKIFPDRRISCALVWTDGPRLMRLSDAAMEAQIAQIRARLDPQGRHS